MKKNNTEFKAVDFMRSARDEMTRDYQENKKSFLEKLKKDTDAFLKARKLKPIKSTYTKRLKKKVTV